MTAITPGVSSFLLIRVKKADILSGNTLNNLFHRSNEGLGVTHFGLNTSSYGKKEKQQKKRKTP